ncbi:MAG: hypothetical protein LQ350_003494 [Teloschistes chrysophthalmus]|nr:MAG: hypothetical protein LQ350_003494 [Niorma chrysophthalma]
MANKQGKMQNLSIVQWQADAKKINYRMRITLTDGRQMTGQMLAFDKHMNLVLADTEEFRRVKRKPTKGAQSAPGSTAPAMVESEEKRTLGLTIVRGTHIVSCSVDGPPPADPSARLGTSAPGGATGAPPTLVAGPGISRPAGRGLPDSLAFRLEDFQEVRRQGLQVEEGRREVDYLALRRRQASQEHHHKDSNLHQAFKDLRVAEDFLQDFKAGDEQITKGCRKATSTKADTANSFFAEALGIIILKAIVKGTRVMRLLHRYSCAGMIRGGLSSRAWRVRTQISCGRRRQ